MRRVKTLSNTGTPTNLDNLRNAAGSPTNDSNILLWDLSTNDVDVVDYRVRRDGATVTTKNHSTHADAKVLSTTTYQHLYRSYYNV